MNEREDGSFLARWSRRKEQSRTGPLPPEPSAPPIAPPIAQATTAVALEPASAEALAPSAAPPPEASAPPPPTLDDVATLTPASDFGRFVARDVSPEVKNAALKKLFADPQFNVMDGLDTYIEDFGRPDPLPRSMLLQMAQASFLGLLDNDEQANESPTPPAATAARAPADEDPDLRLQPDDAAGPAGPAPGAGGEPGRDA